MTTQATNPIDGLSDNVISGETSWRLIYDNGTKKALLLFRSSGTTQTRHSVYTAATKQACLDQAAALGLDTTAIQ